MKTTSDVAISINRSLIDWRDSRGSVPRRLETLAVHLAPLSAKITSRRRHHSARVSGQEITKKTSGR